MDDDRREMASEVMAQGFLIEMLLSLHMAKIPEHLTQKFADDLVGLYRDGVPPMKLSDVEAELLADLRVQATDHIRRHVQTAVEGVAEGHRLQRERAARDQNRSPGT